MGILSEEQTSEGTLGAKHSVLSAVSPDQRLHSGLHKSTAGRSGNNFIMMVNGGGLYDDMKAPTVFE